MSITTPVNVPSIAPSRPSLADARADHSQAHDLLFRLTGIHAVSRVLHGLGFRASKATLIWCSITFLLIAVGWIKSINLILLLGYMLLGVFLVNARKARRCIHRIEVTRRPVDPVFAGEEFHADIDVTNPTPHPTTTLLIDEFAGTPSAWFLTRFAGRDSITLQGRWKSMHRGRKPLGPLVLDSSYPFGVIHAVRVLDSVGDVLVLPELGHVNTEMFRRWLIRGGAGDNPSRRPARNTSLGHGDVRGVRPYRPGDSPRDIHWKTSARRNQLLVREYDRTEPLDLVLIIDPWIPGRNPSPEDQRKLEWILSLAASMVVSWCSGDDPSELTVITPGNPPTVKTGRAVPGFARHALATFADLSGSENIPPIPVSMIHSRSKRSARLCVSTRSGSPLASGLRSSGSTFAVIAADAPPTWFTPPPDLEP